MKQHEYDTNVEQSEMNGTGQKKCEEDINLAIQLVEAVLMLSEDKKSIIPKSTYEIKRDA